MLRSAFESVSSVVLVIVSAIFSILALLIALGGLAGGIWLGFLGEWKLIGIGIAMSLFMPTVFSIAYLPALGLGTIFSALLDKGYTRTGLFLGSITNVYSNLLVMVWVLFVFLYFLGSSGYNSIVPYLLWAMGIFYNDRTTGLHGE
jgi:hypothetical protein